MEIVFASPSNKDEGLIPSAQSDWVLFVGCYEILFISNLALCPLGLFSVSTAAWIVVKKAEVGLLFTTGR